MGLYYTLKNGESIEIDIQENENYEKKILIKLFGGSMYFEYDYYKEDYNLNKIIEDIELNYDKHLEDDKDFEWRCWAD